jgi:hypothetical protein
VADGSAPEQPAAPTCATDSLDRHEALVATASRVRSWLLIEQPGAWGRDALVESALDPILAVALLARCRRAAVRPILIRRPASVRASTAGEPGRCRCYLAHSGIRRSWLESLDLDDPAALLDLDLATLASDRAPGLGQAEAGPLLLVCTNGRHDRCCSDLGRPLVRALVAAGSHDVWECSHIGGDRFAANLVCLPEGVYFGRVAAADGPRIALGYRRGHLSLEHYRGRSSQPALVQAADLFVRRATALTALDALVPAVITPCGDDEADVTFVVPGTTPDAAPGWRVRVSRRRSSSPAVLTCRSDHASHPWEYHLVDLAPLAPVPSSSS